MPFQTLKKKLAENPLKFFFQGQRGLKQHFRPCFQNFQFSLGRCILPQPVIQSRNLISNPATCLTIPQPDKQSRNLLSNHNISPQLVNRSHNLLNNPATSYPIIKSLESQKKNYDWITGCGIVYQVAGSVNRLRDWISGCGYG